MRHNPQIDPSARRGARLHPTPGRRIAAFRRAWQGGCKRRLLTERKSHRTRGASDPGSVVILSALAMGGWMWLWASLDGSLCQIRAKVCPLPLLIIYWSRDWWLPRSGAWVRLAGRRCTWHTPAAEPSRRGQPTPRPGARVPRRLPESDGVVPCHAWHGKRAARVLAAPNRDGWPKARRPRLAPGAGQRRPACRSSRYSQSSNSSDHLWYARNTLGPAG